MMKFSCEKALLTGALAVAGRTVAMKSAISALEGIYISADQELTLTGYNLETGITVKIPAQIQQTGNCVFPARLFAEIVRKLPDDIVNICVDETLHVSIQCGISSFQIAAESGEDYPELPEVESSSSITMPQSALRKLISGTIFSVSENMARPIHTGCLIEAEGDTVTMVAVDGFRLAKRTYHSETAAAQSLKFVVPAAALREVEKILADTDEPVRIYMGSKHILFAIGDATLISRILEGEFLDWRRVVPKNNSILLTANVPTLTASIERVSLIVSEKIKSPVHCKFSENIADFKTATTIGSAHDICPIAGDGKELEIGFNCRYLLDALKAIGCEEVTLELSNGLSPIVMTPVDDTADFAYMVLPVRLKAGE